MSNTEKGRLSIWKKIQIKYAWQRKRLACFWKDPKFDRRSKLIGISALSPTIAVVGGALASNGILSAGPAFVFYMAGALLGLVVLFSMAIRFIDVHFSEFKATKIFGLALIAVASYIAHGKAVAEINGIFSVDAAALPHATSAASVMIICIWVCSLILIPICAGSALLSVYFYWKSKAGNAAMAFAVFISSLLWVSLIEHQISPENRRKGNLYQIALEFDFNKHSRCNGLPANAEGVLFLGADQRRAMVAPRLMELSRSPKSIFRVVQVPTDFKLVTCQ
jgi:hypothetical protein